MPPLASPHFNIFSHQPPPKEYLYRTCTLLLKYLSTDQIMFGNSYDNSFKRHLNFFLSFS